MTVYSVAIAATLALGAGAAVSEESRIDRAFSATGTSCDQIRWSKQSIESHPRLAGACQQVMQRGGKYYVKFRGEVKRVADGGRELTIDLRNGERLTLRPPEYLSLYIDGKPTPVRNLRRGDQLNFYVPEDHLAANFFWGRIAAAPAEGVPIQLGSPEQESSTDSPPDGTDHGRMLGLVGLILAALAGAEDTPSSGPRPP